MNAPVNADPATNAWTIPLEQIDVSDPQLYQDDTWYPYFERLRREKPGPLLPRTASTARTGRSPSTKTSCMSR